MSENIKSNEKKSSEAENYENVMSREKMEPKIITNCDIKASNHSIYP